MTRQYILTIIDPKEKNDERVKALLDSFPEAAEKKFESKGYNGNLEGYMYWDLSELEKNIAVYEMPKTKLDLGKISSRSRAIEIDNQFNIKISFARESDKKRHTSNAYAGNIGIEAASGIYKRLLGDRVAHMIKLIRKNKNVRKLLTKRRGLTRDIDPMYIGVGIENSDSTVLLKASKSGPYVGDKRLFSGYKIMACR